MEAAAAGVAAASRGGASLAMPSSSSSSSSQVGRKEWRAVSDQAVRSAGTEELERGKLGQADERTIYEVQQGAGLDFCSITMGGGLENNDLLQQRLHSVARQREELQEVEIELRGQMIARSEIMEMQKRCDAQIKEQVDELKNNLQEREQKIHELELKMEEKERELRAIKIDNEAAWAKEDLLREQNKELATFRRERDNSEAERAQHLKQMHELKEHIQEKERQFLELEEQNRVAQETILYKDEQLREIQAWVARVQEVDHSIQAEMRERTEHFNQFWLGCQRQFADMERHHLQTIQQLQLELAEARERNGGIYTDESRMTHTDSKDASPFLHNKGNQFNVNESGTVTGNSEVLTNGNGENGLPFVSTGNASTKAEHAAGVPIVPPSILGMGAYMPPGQMTTMHPFVVHQQGIQHSVPSVNSHVPPSHGAHYQAIPGLSSHQHWQNQQTVSEVSQITNQNQYLPSQPEQSLLSPGAHYDYDITANGHVLHSDYLSPHVSPSEKPGPITAAPSEVQVIEQPQPNLQESSSKFHESLGLGSLEQNNETKEQENNIVTVTNLSQEGQGLKIEQPPPSDNPTPHVNTHQAPGSSSSSSDVPLPEVSGPTGRASISQSSGKIPESALLDERQLLACIVRAIPAGSNGRIRISSTLPNRLGKMLAPLHWHDYKKKYGKLDEFVIGHPELFVVEGDFIHLREGAQEIISATAAMAKVAAAAAASAPYSSLLPSVAVTPMAQNHRLKRVPSIDSKSVKIGSIESAALTSADVGGKPPQISSMQTQHSNGIPYNNIIQGLSNVKILSKSRNHSELNGLQSEFRHGHSSVHMTIANGANPDKLGTVASQDKVNGRQGVNFGGKQQGRATMSGLTPRR